MPTIQRILNALLLLLLLTAGIILGRYGSAALQVRRFWDTPASFMEAGSLGSVSSLTILPLYEKTGDTAYVTGHGVSYLIRAGETIILMDLGHNPQGAETLPAFDNMQRLGIDPRTIDLLVISHNHPDHIGGLPAWQHGVLNLGSQPALFDGKPVYLPTGLSAAGAQAQLVGSPSRLAEGVASMGRMPFLESFPFNVWQPLGYEQVLAIHVEGQGLVLITGCGHPSLEKIIERAEALFEQPVIGIAGGLHYLNAGTDVLQPHIQFLAARQPGLVALSPHDNSPAAIDAFRLAFPESYQAIEVGREINFPSAADGLFTLP